MPQPQKEKTIKYYILFFLCYFFGLCVCVFMLLSLSDFGPLIDVHFHPIPLKCFFEGILFLIYRNF